MLFGDFGTTGAATADTNDEFDDSSIEGRCVRSATVGVVLFMAASAVIPGENVTVGDFVDCIRQPKISAIACGVGRLGGRA